MNRKRVFRRKANRLFVFFAGYGLVPVAESLDDKPKFISAAPKRIGDDAIIYVEGQCRCVRLLAGVFGYTTRLFLVDMGPVTWGKYE